MISQMMDVRKFHEKYECPMDLSMYEIGDVRDHGSLAWLRSEFIGEEHDELMHALHMRDRVATLDAILDILYVVYGLAVVLGFTPEQMEDGWDEVHASNMTKVKIQGMDKIQKPEGFKAPDLDKVLGVKK